MTEYQAPGRDGRIGTRELLIHVEFVMRGVAAALWDLFGVSIRIPHDDAESESDGQEDERFTSNDHDVASIGHAR